MSGAGLRSYGAYAGVWLLAQERPTFPRQGRHGGAELHRHRQQGQLRERPEALGFQILEDGIPQKLATFAEGNRPAMQVAGDGAMKPLL